MSTLATLWILSSTLQAAELTVGIGEEYATVQAAVDASEDGDTVRVRSGTYNESVRLKSGLTLIGESPEDTLIQAGRQQPVLDLDRVERVSISGFRLAHEPGREVCGAAVIKAKRVASVEIFDNRIEGSGVTGVSVEQADAVVLWGNKIYENTYTGIWVSMSKDVLIAHNQLWDNKNGIQAYAEGLRVEHNSIHGGEVGLQASGQGGQSANRIADNVVVGSRKKAYQVSIESAVHEGNAVWESTSNGSNGRSELEWDFFAVEQDPRLHAPPSDLSLRADSPLIGAASDGGDIGAASPAPEHQPPRQRRREPVTWTADQKRPLQFQLEEAWPGDVVRFGTGRWNGVHELPSGVLLEGEGSATILDGQITGDGVHGTTLRKLVIRSERDKPAVDLRGVHEIVFDQVILDTTNPQAITIRDSDGVHLLRSRIRGPADGALVVGASRDVALEHVAISSAGRAAIRAVDSDLSLRHVTIAGSEVAVGQAGGRLELHDTIVDRARIAMMVSDVSIEASHNAFSRCRVPWARVDRAAVVKLTVDDSAAIQRDDPATLTQDAKLLAPDEGDLRLLPGSPCQDAASDGADIGAHQSLDATLPADDTEWLELRQRARDSVRDLMVQQVQAIARAEVAYHAAFNRYVPIDEPKPRPVEELEGSPVRWTSPPEFVEIGWEPRSSAVWATFRVEAEGGGFVVYGTTDLDGDGVPAQAVATRDGEAVLETPADVY